MDPAGTIRVADREIEGMPLRVHYPARREQPAPAVLFSHGFGGSRLGYAFLGRALAARGYVSIHPTHRDPATVAEAMADPRAWETRPRDLARIVDLLPRIASLIPALGGDLDADRIAIAGHSFGAFGALLCAGARAFPDGGALELREPRARAFVALSPPGNGSRGLRPQSWGGLERPLLAMTGTLDAGPRGEPPEWRLEPFSQLPPGNKTLVVLDGADHEAFAGGLPRRRAEPGLLRAIESTVLWFCDRHLRGRDEPLAAAAGARVLHR